MSLWHSLDVANRWNWVRNWRLWRDYASYFPVQLVKEKDLDPKYNYIVGSHPHGILCSGAFCNFATEGTGVATVFPGISFFLTTLSVQFKMPFFREFLMTSGAVSASRKSLDYILSSSPGGNAVVLIVGGAPEALDTHPAVTDITLILKPRKGFIKMALKHGYKTKFFMHYLLNDNDQSCFLLKEHIWFQRFRLAKIRCTIRLITLAVLN